MTSHYVTLAPDRQPSAAPLTHRLVVSLATLSACLALWHNCFALTDSLALWPLIWALIWLGLWPLVDLFGPAFVAIALGLPLG